MKTRILSIMDTRKKRAGVIITAVVLIFVLSTSLVLASSNGGEVYWDFDFDDQSPEFYIPAQDARANVQEIPAFFVGGIGVITNATEVVAPYFITVNDEGEEAANALDTFGWFLNTNDVVLVHGAEGNYFQITVPHGSIPRIRASVNKNYVNFTPDLAVTSNHVAINNAVVFDDCGNEVGVKSGVAVVLERADGRALIQFIDSTDSFWVIDDLTFEFETAHLSE